MVENFLLEMEKVKVIDESIARFGVEAQLGKTIEELSELLADIVQYKKYYTRDNIPPGKLAELRDNILTERVDVGIMLKDLDLIFNYTFNETKDRFDQQFYKLIKYVENARKPE